MPNPQVLRPNVPRYSERFSDIRMFFSSPKDLVGSSNFYRVEKPADDAKEENRKRRYRISK